MEERAGALESMGGLMEERKNILLVTSVSRYASSDKYIEAWAAALRQMGCNTCVLDGWSLAQPALYNHVISTCKFDAVIDINGILCSWGITGNLPKETIYGTYVCDPPSGIRANLRQADNRTVIFGCDRNFCAYMERHIPAVRHVEFIPLSGEAYSAATPYEKRAIDIIFTGTYQDPVKIREKELAKFDKGGVLERFAEDMLEDIINHPQHTLQECLSRILEKYGQEVNDQDFDDLMADFLWVDFYARFYYRDKVIRSLLDAGLQIHVFGNGWDDFQLEYKENLVIHEGGSYAAGKALANAKIALNIMPWFKDAFQERIASAMLSKTVAVTDESKYINENFINNEELLIFSLQEIDSLAGRIKYLLEHSAEASKIAERGYQKIQSHTWKDRTYDMVKKMERNFGLSFMRAGDGRELEYEIEYPNRQSLLLDAAYELYKMARFADQDIGKIENLSKEEGKFLLEKFQNFMRHYSNCLEVIEMNSYIRDCLQNFQENFGKDIVKLFSLQCKALMGELLLEEKGVRI